MADWIATARLRLRPWREEDLDAFAALTADPQVMRFVGDGGCLDRAATANWLANANRNLRGWGCGTHAVWERDGERPIGWAGLMHNGNAPAPAAAEIIYALAPSAWGRGYAGELVAGLVGWARERRGLATVLATIDPDNLASCKIVERQGFELERIVEEEDGKTAYYWLSWR